MKKKKLIMMSVLGIVMAAVIFGPVLSKLQDRLVANKKMRQELDTLEKKLSQLEGIDKQLISERVSKMEAVFPSDKPVVQLLSTLSQLSAEYNLGFGGVTLQPGSIGQKEPVKKEAKKPATLYQDLKFGFEVAGDFGSILNFMKALEATAPLMKIDKLGLTIKTNPLFSDQRTQVVAEIDVSAFYQPVPETIGSITRPVELLTRTEEISLNQLFNFKQFPLVLPVAATGKTDLFDLNL